MALRSLSDSELLTIIIRSGSRGENAVELAKKIFKKFGKENLPHLSFNSFKNIKGIGMIKTCQIIAVLN